MTTSPSRKEIQAILHQGTKEKVAQQKREEIARYARRSLQVEGLELTEDAHKHSQLYIKGEMNTEQMLAELRKKYNVDG